MAALGAPNDGLFTDWTLKELLRARDRRALPAFLRWETTLDMARCLPQDAVGCYMLGEMGCARYLEAPVLLEARTDVERAWQAYRAILFWTYKPGLSAHERDAAAGPWWERL